MKKKCTSYCKTSCEIASTTIARGKNSFILKFIFPTCDHYPYLLNVQQILCIYCFSCQVWWVGLLSRDFENSSLFGEREQTNSYT
jgi:hypothetical protein